VGPGAEGVRAMSTRHASHRARVAALSCVLLLHAACTADEPSGSSSASADADAVPEATGRVTDPGEAGDAVPASCPSETLRSWSLGAITTRRLVAYGTLEDVAVSRTGRATVAWTVSVDSGEVRTMDVPAAPGDPQSPAGPPDPQHREVFDVFGDGVLGVDAADTQTLLWLSDERGHGGGPAPFTEFFDILVADRPPGGRWSTSPTVLGAGLLAHRQLAVNQAGAAVVAWSRYEGRRTLVYASYREAAGAEWTPMELVATDASSEEVGIDDAGRVLLLFTRGHNARTRLYAVRRTPTHGWAAAKRLPGGWLQDDFALGANGSAVVVRNRVSYEGETPQGSQFTVWMTPSGSWQPPVRQPALTEGVYGRSVDMDAKGGALLAWWDGTDLTVRWSRPDGEWRRPCVLAADVKRPRSLTPDARLSVNRRGDALVVWGARGRVTQLWARFKPAGHAWSNPVKVTRGSNVPDWFTTDLGDRGHAAIAWMPRNGRQIVVRTTSLNVGGRD